MNRIRLSARHLVATGVALAVVVAATVTGWLAIDRLDKKAASGETTESLDAAYGVARHAGLLVSASAVPTNFRMTPEHLAEISDSVAQSSAAMNDHLEVLEAHDRGGRADRIREHADALLATAELIENQRPELVRMLAEGQADLRDFRYGFSKELEAAMVTSIDDQIYHMMTNYDESGQPLQSELGPIPEDVLRLYHIATLANTQGVAIIKLRGAAVLPYANMIPYIQEDFESEVQRLERSINYLAENGAPNLHPDAVSLLQQVVSYGEGENNIWDRTTARLQMAAVENRQIAEKERILEHLYFELDEVVADINQRADDANDSVNRDVLWALIVLLVIAVMGVLSILAAARHLGAKPGDSSEGEESATPAAAT